MGPPLTRSNLIILCVSWLRAREFGRFIVVGGINTVVTYIVYVALVAVLRYPVAYSVTYVLGIVLSYYLNARFVFRRKLRATVALQYPIVYLLQYLLGLVLLYALVEIGHFSKLIAPIFALFITVPITYAASRCIIDRE